MGEIRIIKVDVEPDKFYIQYVEKGMPLWAIVLKLDLWTDYIVPKKLNITGDDEEYEINEFYTDCEMIAVEIAKKWLIKQKSKQKKQGPSKEGQS